MSNRQHTHFSRGLVIAVAATTVLAMASGTGVSAPGSTPVAETSARVGEYEPNDAVTQATDLGLAGTTVNAAIETPNDVDLFEFYIVQTGSQAFFPITNTTPDARYTESIEAEIRDASGTVLTESGYGELAEGESDTVSYSFTPGRYYLAIESEYSDDDLVRSYTFSVNGSTVDAATMQSICDQSQAQVTVAAKKVRRAKKALRRADTPREIRKARARFKAAKKALRAAERRSVTYCVVL